MTGRGRLLGVCVIVGLALIGSASAPADLATSTVSMDAYVDGEFLSFWEYPHAHWDRADAYAGAQYPETTDDDVVFNVDFLEPYAAANANDAMGQAQLTSHIPWGGQMQATANVFQAPGQSYGGTWMRRQLFSEAEQAVTVSADYEYLLDLSSVTGEGSIWLWMSLVEYHCVYGDTGWVCDEPQMLLEPDAEWMLWEGDEYGDNRDYVVKVVEVGPGGYDADQDIKTWLADLHEVELDPQDEWYRYDWVAGVCADPTLMLGEPIMPEPGMLMLFIVSGTAMAGRFRR